MFLIPLVVLLSAGVGVVVALTLASTDDRELPVNEPDLVIPPSASPALKAQASGYDPRWNGKIYKLVDKILPLLKQASETSGVPLGVLVGWISAESGGRLGAAPSVKLKGEDDFERGYFQLSPSESKSLGIDHKRLSTDPTYSINSGLKLIARCMGRAAVLDVAPKNSRYFWLLTKFQHSIGVGAAKKIVEAAKAAGETRTWERLRDWAIAHEKELFSLVKHSPTKWFGLTDKVVKIGEPFGFGSYDTIVGGEVFSDIVDPLDALS